jgi:hypothetical protein
MDLKNDPALQGHKVKMESVLGLGTVVCGLFCCWILVSSFICMWKNLIPNLLEIIEKWTVSGGKILWYICMNLMTGWQCARYCAQLFTCAFPIIYLFIYYFTLLKWEIDTWGKFRHCSWDLSQGSVGLQNPFSGPLLPNFIHSYTVFMTFLWLSLTLLIIFF